MSAADEESRDSTPSDGLSGTLSPAPSHGGDVNGSDASNGLTNPHSPASPIAPKSVNKEEQQFIKRPLNAYMMWTVENRQRIVAENPTMKMNDISKLMGEMWKALTDEERKPFFEKAVKSKLEHKQVLKENPQFVYRPQKKPQKKDTDLSATSNNSNSASSHHTPATPTSTNAHGAIASRLQITPLPASPAATPYLQQRLNGGPLPPQMNQHAGGGPSSSIVQALGSRPTPHHQPYPPPQQIHHGGTPMAHHSTASQQAQRPPTMHTMLDMYYVSLCQPAFPEPGEPGLAQMPPQYYYDQYQQMHYQQVYSQHHHEQQILQNHGMTY